MRTAQLRKCILEVLEQCGTYALPEATLKSHVRGLLRPVPSDEEWEDALSWMKSSETTVNVPDAFGGEPQWAITEKGKVMLRQAP